MRFQFAYEVSPNVEAPSVQAVCCVMHAAHLASLLCALHRYMSATAVDVTCMLAACCWIIANV